MSDTDQYGLIILGNSGVGKSFLANILLGREAFVHEFQPQSVTHVTEYQEIDVGYYPLAIFNIPGLIEAEQERIELNKKEIDKAFSLRPNSIVMFVFGQTGGRIKEEDIVAFNAINDAYPFKKGSLVFAVNELPKKRPSNYEGTAIVLLQQLLRNVVITDQNICFLDLINTDNAEERQHIKEQLLKILANCLPSKHEKVGEIETVLDQLKKQKEIIKEQGIQFNREKEQYVTQITQYQEKMNEINLKHQSEIESFQKAIERQEQMYAEQQRQYEEDKKRHEIQLDALHSDAQKAQANYDNLLKDKQATKEMIETFKARCDELTKECQILASRPPPPPQIIYRDGPTKTKRLCVIS